jgi:hypothetical protein
MREGRYITADTFEMMCKNQTELIDIMNHRLTKMEVNVSWIKKLMNVQTTLLTGTFLALLGIMVKLVF